MITFNPLPMFTGRGFVMNESSYKLTTSVPYYREITLFHLEGRLPFRASKALLQLV